MYALGDALLVVARVEDRAAVLRAAVAALAVELGRVVGDGEEDAQELAVGELAGVVGDFDRLGVAGSAGAGGLVVGGGLVAAAVAAGDVADAGQALEDGLGTPEAPAGQDGGLRAGLGQVFGGVREGFGGGLHV